jgi:SAM-dependent MidA family methyltransferase
MNPLTELLRDEIAIGGPVSFRRFMDCALYHPELGYYRRPRDPFGKSGDFFTAEQLQPVFGELIAARVREIFEEMDRPSDFTVVEPGAGRGEMSQAFSEWRYVPVEIDAAALPGRFSGVVFSNEFFDALPVEVAVRRGETFREMRVGFDGAAFAWIESGPVSEPAADYLARYIADCEEGDLVEIHLEALARLERIAASLVSGFVITVDYGYTRRERVRFPRGTLMSYRRHTALEDVLSDPGKRDITAHVPFTALEEHGKRCGLEPVRFETLARMLLGVGERGAFDRALAASDTSEEARRRLQLKTLLFGMGETFRVLTQKKSGTEGAGTDRKDG